MKRRRIVTSDDDESESDVEFVKSTFVDVAPVHAVVAGEVSGSINETDENKPKIKTKTKEPALERRCHPEKGNTKAKSSQTELDEITPNALFCCILRGHRPKGSISVAEVRIRVKESVKLPKNFTKLGPQHLKEIFDAIDEHYFFGCLRPLLRAERRKVTFRVSDRMTSRAGQVLTDYQHSPLAHEVAVSSFLLFKAFSDPRSRGITVNGLECRDRLDALLRIVEHEMVHLLFCCDRATEALGLGTGRDGDRKEGYHGPTFQSAVLRLFGHTHTQHDLITPAEVAHDQRGVCVGRRVRFPFEGGELCGVVNRVQKSVTVLVRDLSGGGHRDSVEMSDGNFYRKFYVPIEDCTAI